MESTEILKERAYSAIQRVYERSKGMPDDDSKLAGPAKNLEIFLENLHIYHEGEFRERSPAFTKWVINLDHLNSDGMQEEMTEIERYVGITRVQDMHQIRSLVPNFQLPASTEKDLFYATFNLYADRIQELKEHLQTYRTS